MKLLPGMLPGQDFTASGIFTPKSQRYGSGIFADRYSMPKSVYTEPMYAGAQVVPGDMAFFRSALSGAGDLVAKVPGGWLGAAGLAALALYFTVGIPVLGWRSGRRKNPRRRRRARRSYRYAKRAARFRARVAAAQRDPSMAGKSMSFYRGYFGA